MTSEITIQDWATETAFLYMEQGLTGDRLTPGWDLSGDDWDALDRDLGHESTREERDEVRRIVEGIILDSSWEVGLEGDDSGTVVLCAPDIDEEVRIFRASVDGGIILARQLRSGEDFEAF